MSLEQILIARAAKPSIASIPIGRWAIWDPADDNNVRSSFGFASKYVFTGIRQILAPSTRLTLGRRKNAPADAAISEEDLLGLLLLRCLRRWLRR
jgi:hypothetical protein